MSARVGLVGYGLAGEVFHARLIRACRGLTLAAVVTRDPARAERVRRDHPEALVLPDVESMLADGGQLDVVVVAATNDVHASVAGQALDAGCAVVVDKPLALSAAEGDALVAKARQLGLGLTVFQNRRLDSDQLTLARLIADGQLGRVYRHESRFERWRPLLDRGKWRETLPAAQGGGQLLDLGSHLVDQSVSLFGRVERVYAEVTTGRGGADDFVFVALTHEGGVSSHLSLGALFGAPGPRRRVLGDAAAFVVADLDGQEQQLRDGVDPASEIFGTQPPQTWGRLVRGDAQEPVTPEKGDWVGFYDAVAASLATGSPMPVDPSDAVEVLRIIEAARRSAAEGVVATP